MSKIGLLFVLLVSGCCLSCTEKKQGGMVENAFSVAEQQLTAQLKAVPEPVAFPRTIRNGELYTTKMNDWTEGFYPGCLWYIYENNRDESWKQSALKWTEALEPLKKLTNHHDIGFLMYCSFGNAYRLTGNEAYKDVLVESARSLCTRFNEKTGCIESWNYRKAWNGKDEWFFPVIIDNMMNLEMLFWASEQTGNSKYQDIAIAHADKTLKNHFRDNMTSYHVVSYSVPSGKVESKGTFQGYSDSSAWARGQAWGVYGYTMCYRFTKNPAYLDAAHKIARFIMENRPLENDYIPYWDYDAPGIPNAPRDASASAVTASALLELCGYTDDKNLSNSYVVYAENILKQLSSPDYLAKEKENNGFILMHSVGSFPHDSEVDVPLNYADYYYLEALKRYKDLKKFS